MSEIVPVGFCITQIQSQLLSVGGGGGGGGGEPFILLRDIGTSRAPLTSSGADFVTQCHPR